MYNYFGTFANHPKGLFMNIDTSAKVKELYDYMDKVYKFSEKVMKFLEETISNINISKENDEVSQFLKELAEKDIHPFYLKIKQKLDMVNTPVRIVKKGFEKVYNEKINELISFLNFINDNLQIILNKIEEFQESLISKRANFTSFLSYYQSSDEEIENYLKTAIHRVIHSKIVYFENELEKLKQIQDPEQIIIFLQNFKVNVNKFITEQLYANISGLFSSLKDTISKKVEAYLNQLDLPEEKKNDLLYKVEVFINSYEVVYPLIYFEIPDVSRNFFDPSQKYNSAIDKFMENIFSFRFFSLFILGLIVALIGIYQLYYEGDDISLVISIIGVFFILFSIIDAMFFNKKYVKTFMDEKKALLLFSIKENLDQIEKVTLESMLEQKNNLIKGINELIMEEFETYSLGGKRLENLKENIKSLKEEGYNLLNQLKFKLEENAT